MANSSKKLEFKKDGVEIFSSFLEKDSLKELILELEKIFLLPSINGSIYSANINHQLKTIPFSSAMVRSVNLLEIAIDILNLIKLRSRSFKSYCVTNIEIFKESNNPDKLPFHTDSRKGMIRAQIYIKGGKESSGAFSYACGSHKRDYFVEHHLSPSQFEFIKESIYDCFAPEGSLILFDPYGFHGKYPCIKPRITVMFEFQEKSSNYPKSNIYIASHLLSQKVMENIEIFQNEIKSGVFNHGNDAILKSNNYQINFKYGIKILIISIIFSLKSTTKKIINSIKHGPK